jgi:hypothetical protein
MTMAIFHFPQARGLDAERISSVRFGPIEEAQNGAVFRRFFVDLSRSQQRRIEAEYLKI